MEFHVDPRNGRPLAGDSGTRVPPPRGATCPPEGGWSAWYLRDEDDVGESTEQGITVRTLLAALAELAREREWTRTLVAGDQFFAWVESEPLVRISPDVYLLDDPPAPPYPGMWRTWLPGQAPPQFAVEVVSDDWAKDYVHAPRKYDQLGTRELVVFDPEAALAPRSRRVVLQMFRRDATGALVRVDVGQGPFHSVELDAWLVVQSGPGGARLRIARDREGRDLVATADELVAGLRRENHSLHARVAALESQVAGLQAVIALQKDLLAEQAAGLAERDATISRLEAGLAERDATIARLETALAERDATIARLEAALAERDATIARLEVALGEGDRRHDALQDRVGALEAALARLLDGR